jgi:hypothetical protein
MAPIVRVRNALFSLIGAWTASFFAVIHRPETAAVKPLVQIHVTLIADMCTEQTHTSCLLTLGFLRKKNVKLPV